MSDAPVRRYGSVRAAVAARPLTIYFVLAFAVPWIAGTVAAGPALLRNEPVEVWQAWLLFATMLLGPSSAGVVLTALLDGRRGLDDLAARTARWRVAPRWYGAALLPFPVLSGSVLAVLAVAVASRFAPGFLPFGVVIGLLAGFFEEIGWTGFALPRMQARLGALGAATILGLLWSLWHLAADLLGSFVQLGPYWLPHFAAFCVAMTATRIVMVWVYNHTASVFLAQFMHASSTGFLAALGPRGLAPADETLWLAIYAAVVVVIAAAVASAMLGSADR